MGTAELKTVLHWIACSPIIKLVFLNVL